MPNLAKIPPMPQDAPPSLLDPAAMEAPPEMGAPAAPLVSRIPTQGEQNIAHDQAKLQKVQWNQEHPWGTPENHPGKLGKIAHAFSTLGNIAGDIVAPNVMANIPQTQLGMKTEEGQLAKRIGTEQTEESQNQERGAQTAKAQEDTLLAPGKAASEEGLQEAQTENLQTPAFQHLETDQGIFAFNPKTKELMPLTYQGQPLTPHDKPTAGKGLEHVSVVGPNGKPMEANFHPDTGKYTDSTGKEIVNPQPYEKPNQGGMVTVIAPDPNTPGGGIVERLGAGAHLAPGSQTATQFGSVNTPTTQQRNVSAQASLVNEQMPGLINEIRQNASLLGPVSGRWNEFMQGKVGMDNPAMAGLRSDLLMMSSAVALMHARGRLPENLREEFDRTINAPKQTPENLITSLQHIQKWTQANMHAMGGGQGGANTQENAPQKQWNPKTGRYE